MIAAAASLGANLGLGAVVEAWPERVRYLGRLHPLLVHLPLGGVFALLALEALRSVRPAAELARACSMVLGICALGGILAAVAGALLAEEGGQTGSTLALHRWLASAVALVLLWAWALGPRMGRGAYLGTLFAAVGLVLATGHFGGSLTHGPTFLARVWRGAPEAPEGPAYDGVAARAGSIPVELEFEPVRETLARFCFECHGPERQKGKLRLDTLDPDLVAGPDAEHWREALQRVQVGEMPPPDKPQPNDLERRAFVAWGRAGLARAAASRAAERGPLLRRLTKAQITHTLQDLLGVPVDFARDLPDDGKSARGFSNDGRVLQASALHLDLLRDVAAEALAEALPAGPRPEARRFRIVFGRGVGRGHPGAEIGGYQAVPLSSDDFRIEVLDADGVPLAGSRGAELDELGQRIGVGLRGSSSDRFHVTDDGIVLLGALPHVERAPESWQGPSPNLKLELQRCFPERGELRMTVTASRGALPRRTEQMFLSPDEPQALALWDDAAGALAAPPGALVLTAEAAESVDNLESVDGVLVPLDLTLDCRAELQLEVPTAGYYQVDLLHPPASVEAMTSIRVEAAGGALDLRPAVPGAEPAEGGSTPGTMQATAVGIAYLERGPQRIAVGGPFFAGLAQLTLSPLGPDHPQVARLSAEVGALEAAVAHEVPALRALCGTRTDDGMDYREFGPSVAVHAGAGQPQAYEFRARLEDLPVPEPESGDTEILSGILLLGVWNDHLVKSATDPGPPLEVHSIEIEAPYFEQWPPASYRSILFDPTRSPADAEYVRAVLERFLTRAFRRPAEAVEVEAYLEHWRGWLSEVEDPVLALRETLAAALNSPQFLFLVEPALEPGALVDGPALAARLSYFLWDSAPDARLTELAESGRLADELLQEVDRLLDDPRAERFVRAFTTEWLRLDRLEGMTLDPGRYPDFSRFVKRDAAEETFATVGHALRADRTLMELIDSDVVVLNQNLAEYYGVEGVIGQHFRAVELGHGHPRGGLLTQASFLAGHSDGLDAHPIKRAVWVKDRLLGEVPPPPPPPNVPELDSGAPEMQGLSLAEQLALHRDKTACMDCHAALDPFGLVFQRYDASGRIAADLGRAAEALATLPDGTQVDGVAGLARYLTETRRDDLARATIRHLMAYALGRGLDLGDAPAVERCLEQVQVGGYRLRAVIRSIVLSPTFRAP